MRLPEWVEEEVERIAKGVSSVAVENNRQRLVECTTCGCLIYPSADNNFPTLEKVETYVMRHMGFGEPEWAKVDHYYCKAHAPDIAAPTAEEIGEV